MITYTQLGSNGRLGNQLFQYAATKSAAIINNCLFAIPIENHNLLKYFNLNCRFYSLNSNVNTLSKLNKFIEKGFHYNESFINISDNTDLYGYFQSEKYFKNIKNDLLQDLTFKDHILNLCKEKMNNIKTTYDKKICSLHVRRGDYINIQNYHPLCSLQYYNKAIEIIGDNLFLVFSDDIKWCRENFVGSKYIFSDSTTEEEDLCMMSLCDNNIIANSSFSWWGAWLNKNIGKTVVSPKIWFGPSYYDHETKDLYCDDWIKI